jgi:hypothetical protein
MEKETHKASKRGATTRDPVLKLSEPNVWALDLRFNVRAYAVAASTQSRSRSMVAA